MRRGLCPSYRRSFPAQHPQHGAGRALEGLRTARVGTTGPWGALPSAAFWTVIRLPRGLDDQLGRPCSSSLSGTGRFICRAWQMTFTRCTFPFATSSINPHQDIDWRQGRRWRGRNPSLHDVEQLTSDGLTVRSQIHGGEAYLVSLDQGVLIETCSYGWVEQDTSGIEGPVVAVSLL